MLLLNVLTFKSNKQLFVVTADYSCYKNQLFLQFQLIDIIILVMSAGVEKNEILIVNLVQNSRI